MANMLDYLDWRGDLPVAADGWNAVDALILANFCYNELSDLVSGEGVLSLRELMPHLDLPEKKGSPFYTKWRLLIFRMAETVRFGDMRIHDYADITDESRNIQFAAVTVDFADGSSFVCFRGTDGSVVGWREDFNMAFEYPVPAQAAAVRYLEHVARKTDGPLRICGHSKGGNLSVYASVHADEAVQSRIRAVYSFDGPGLDDESMASQGYARIRGVVRSYIPQASVVGLLLSYHPEYVIVKSNSHSLLQHDAFTWQLMGPDFVEVENVSRGSRLMDETLHEWLRECSPDQRRLLVNTLFDVLQSADGETFSDLFKNPKASLSAILGAARQVDLSTMMMIGKMVKRLAQIGVGNIAELMGRDSDNALPEGKTDSSEQ